MAVEFQKAKQLIMNRVITTEPEMIDLDHALNRVMAEDQIALMNVPPFSRSPLDGYVMRAEDTKNASPRSPVKLTLSGSIDCGEQNLSRVLKGRTMRISTGAPIPKGADTVIAREEAREDQGIISVFQPLSPGDNLVTAGEDIKCGELVIKKGTALKPAHIGILASMGKAEVAVFRRPQVGIISTGRELVNPGLDLPKAKIYDCNGPMIAALVESCGGIPLKRITVEDNVHLLAEALKRLLDSATAIVSTGGVSVGDEDLIFQALNKIGAEILFWRLKMKPGTPMLVAVKDNKLIFCLSGNPGAAHVTFDLLVRPALLSISGYNNWRRPKFSALLEHALNKNNGQNRYIRAKCIYSLADGQYRVRAAERERPGVLSASAEANALIFRKAGSASLQAGDLISVELTDLPEVITGTRSLVAVINSTEEKRHIRRFFPKSCPDDISGRQL